MLSRKFVQGFMRFGHPLRCFHFYGTAQLPYFLCCSPNQFYTPNFRVARLKRPLKGLEKYCCFWHTPIIKQRPQGPSPRSSFLGMHINKIGNYLSRASQNAVLQAHPKKKNCICRKINTGVVHDMYTRCIISSSFYLSISKFLRRLMQ